MIRGAAELAWSWIQRTLQQYAERDTVFFLDTCHAGFALYARQHADSDRQNVFIGAVPYDKTTPVGNPKSFTRRAIETLKPAPNRLPIQDSRQLVQSLRDNRPRGVAPPAYRELSSKPRAIDLRPDHGYVKISVYRFSG